MNTAAALSFRKVRAASARAAAELSDARRLQASSIGISLRWPMGSWLAKSRIACMRSSTTTARRSGLLARSPSSTTVSAASGRKAFGPSTKGPYGPSARKGNSRRRSRRPNPSGA